MTRFARVAKKKHLEATPWSELVASGTSASNSSTHQETGAEQNFDGAMEKSKKKSLKRKHLDRADESLSGQKHKKHHHKHKKDEKRKKKHSILGKEMRSTFDEKAEKNREARRQRRKKSKLCFNCREPGHQMSDCPQTRKVGVSAGTCYKCGSSDHTAKLCAVESPALKEGSSFPFAKCFICNETGHISRQCPDNPKGLYPNGGCCRCCGSVEHFKKDCPENQKSKNSGIKAEAEYTVHSSSKHRGHLSADSQAELVEDKKKQKLKRTGPKIVSF